MKDLMSFSCLMIGLACLILGGWNLMIVIGKIIIPEKPEPGSIKIPGIPILESIFMFLAGLLLLYAAYYSR